MTTTLSSQFRSQRQQLLPVILLLVVILAAAAEAQGQQRMARRQCCRHKCGNMSIPLPFGIGRPGCFRDCFQVVCNHFSDPPRAFLADDGIFKREAYSKDPQSYSNDSRSPVELVSISVATGEARVYAAVAYRCSTINNESFYAEQDMNFSDTPFAVSATGNVLIGVGVAVEAQLGWSVSETAFTCRTQGEMSMPTARNGSCTGWGCCEDTLPGVAALLDNEGSGKYFTLSVNPVAVGKNWRWETNPCSYGMLVEKSWYNFSTPDLDGYKTLLERFPRGVALTLDFVAGNDSCPAEGQPRPRYYACVSGNSYCANATYTPGYICKCWDHYAGNPYVPNGCQDIDECKLLENPCSNGGICQNTHGGYDCPCKFGMKDDGKGGACTDIFPVAAKMTVGAIVGILLMAVLSFLVILHKEKKKTK